MKSFKKSSSRLVQPFQYQVTTTVVICTGSIKDQLYEQSWKGNSLTGLYLLLLKYGC